MTRLAETREWEGETNAYQTIAETRKRRVEGKTTTTTTVDETQQDNNAWLERGREGNKEKSFRVCVYVCVCRCICV